MDGLFCNYTLFFSWFQFTHVGPRLIPFVKTVIIYFVAWIPDEYPSLFAALIKCLPILCLALFVWLQGVSLEEKHDYQRRIFVGLIFSCIGDALLIWPDPHFVTAMISFAIAHVSYIRAFGFSQIRWPKAVPFYISLPFVCYWFYPGLQGILIPGVFIYVAIILSMGWRAFASVDIMENIWTWNKLCGVIGATSFIVSDLVIGINKFVTPISFSKPLIMVSYYLAQLFFALSAVQNSNVLIKLRMSNKKTN